MDYFDPVAAVDAEGEVVERYGFTAFGRREVMAPDGSPREESLFDWSFGFHGQFLDSETGYYNYGYRYYVPWLGRWPNRDPIEEKGGANLYGFTANNPVVHVDYLGRNVPLAIEIIRRLYPECEGAIRQAMHSWDNPDFTKSDKYRHCMAHCEVEKNAQEDYPRWQGYSLN